MAKIWCALMIIGLVLTGCTVKTNKVQEKTVATNQDIPAFVYQFQVTAGAGGKSVGTHQLGLGERPLVSPDGDKLAYVQNGQLYIGWLDGSRSDQVISVERFGEMDSRIGEYAWAADSKRLAYVVETSRRLAQPRVFSYNLESTRSKLMFDGGQQKYQTVYNLQWLNDGAMAFWANNLSSTHLYLAEPHQSTVKRMQTKGEMYSLNPQGPQGAYIQEQQGRLALYLHDRDTGQSQLIATLPDETYIIHMNWNPQGNLLALWGNGLIYLVDPTSKQVRQIKFSQNQLYPEEVVWGPKGAGGQKLLVSTVTGMYQGETTVDALRPVAKAVGLASFSPEGELYYQQPGQGGTPEIWTTAGNRNPILTQTPQGEQNGMVGSGVKSGDVINNGMEDGRIKPDLSGATALAPDAPAWQAVSTSLEKYFIGKRWQGYGLVDRLYQLPSGHYYAVVLVYYLEQDAYYPEAYEAILTSQTAGLKVTAYELLPFSPQFEP